MHNVKARTKELLGQALLRSGLWERTLQRWAGRGEAIVLTYHRVIEKWDWTLDYSQPGMVVTSDTFDRQLAFLKEHFNIVPLSYFIAPTPNTKHPKPLCAITFDDGWRDNYDTAFPILRKHDMPATIFLPTDFIETNRAFWHTELIYLLLHGELSQLMRNHGALQAYSASVRRHLMRLAQMKQAPSVDEVDRFIEALKKTSNEDTIDALIRDLADAVGLRRPFFPSGRRFFLDWEQVRKMAAAAIEIGSHGCTHRDLCRMREEAAVQELTLSKHEVENQINQRVDHFAFPYGAWNPRLLGLVAQAGYRTACTDVNWPPQSCACHVLNRVGAHEGISAGVNATFREGTIAFALIQSQKVLAW